MPPTISPAASVPASAITEPTERSMPPVRITYVIPTAMMALIETWRPTFSMLLTDRKLLLAKAITTHTKMRPSAG